MTRERTDVVYGADPFKGDQYSRPWCILNDKQYPFHGDQYLVVPLTTKDWYDGLVPIPERAWINGGTPEPSNLVPWTVHTLDEADIEFCQGTLEASLVDQVTSTLTSYLAGRSD